MFYHLPILLVAFWFPLGFPGYIRPGAALPPGYQGLFFLSFSQHAWIVMALLDTRGSGVNVIAAARRGLWSSG